MILEVRGGGLQLRMDSERGARIVSIQGANGREWLAPSTDNEPTSWGDPFVRNGMGGWDEIVPSVAATRLADGTCIPDHGDAWSVPWTIEAHSASVVTLAVQLTSMPIRLTRTVSATASGVRLSYRATTSSVRPIPFSWSAHPQFLAELTSVVSVAASNMTVRPALVREYPSPRGPLAFPSNAVLNELNEGRSLKAFVQESAVVDSATLTHPDGDALTLRWHAGSLPYLGLFWDRCEFAGRPVIAIEPTTAFGDDAGGAEASGRIVRLSSSAPLDWTLDLLCSLLPLVDPGGGSTKA
ncbi:MAG: hypothetical protein M3N46_12800 [Actinomycetota bacterium]|nr:hypothetical protein [Actinomycetota bacterium]